MGELFIVSVAQLFLGSGFLFIIFFSKYCSARLSIDQVHRTDVGDFVVVVVQVTKLLLSRLVGQVGGRGSGR